MASNSRFEQLCAQFATNMAKFLGYTVVSPQSDTEDGWLLTGSPTSEPLRIFKRASGLSRSESPPTIVLVAQGGPIISPDIVGNQRAGKSGATSESDGQPVRCIRVRQFSIRVSLWGANQEQVEDLLHDAINAFEMIAGAVAVTFSQELWENQQEGRDANSQLGELISFVATLNIQVTTLPQSLGHVATIRNEIELGDDANTEEQVIT